MGHGGVLLVFVGVFVLVIAVSLAIRRPVQRRLFAGTGIEEWRAVARRLPWRDRWTLSVATNLGRAVPPRLAPMAIQRGEVVAASIERLAARRGLRRVWWLLGGLGLVNLVLTVVMLLTDDGASGLWRLISPLLLVALGFGGRPLQDAQIRLAHRSVARSREHVGA